MNPLYLLGVGLAAPGLPTWDLAQPILRGESAYAPVPLPDYLPLLLPANERRRSTPLIRLAFRSAEQAVAGSGRDPAELATVFASSGGDTGVVNRTSSALAREPRIISPTDFHNSVHNAPAGYWAIATGARGCSTSLAARDASFAAGLLGASALLSEGADVLLVVYDQPHPEPLHARRPLTAAASVALVLSATPSAAAVAVLELESTRLAVETQLTDADLELLRGGNPAGRALPLLQQLALGCSGDVVIADVGGRLLRIHITPC